MEEGILLDSDSAVYVWASEVNVAEAPGEFGAVVLERVSASGSAKTLVC